MSKFNFTMPEIQEPPRKEARYGLAALAIIALLLMLLWARGYFAADASTPPSGHGPFQESQGTTHSSGNGGHSVPDRHSHGVSSNLPGDDVDYVTYKDGTPWIFHEPPKDSGVGPTPQDWFAGQPDEQSNSGPGFMPGWTTGNGGPDWAWGGGGAGGGGGGGGGGGNGCQQNCDKDPTNGPKGPGTPDPGPNPPGITNPGPNTPVSAVPEPAVWAMMLVGFGAVGFSLRRAKKLSAVTV